MTARVAAIGEGDVLEAHLATRDAQRLGGRLVDDRVRPRQGAHAVLDGADVLEQRRDLPHDPVRDAVQAQRHRAGGRDRADADLALCPQPQRHARGGRDQRMLST